MIAIPMFVAAQLASARVELACPEYIRTDQTLVSQAQGGAPGQWHVSTSNDVVVDDKLMGEFYGFSSGPPEQMALLKPNDIADNKYSSLSTWAFNHSETIWLVCGFEHTVIRLSRPLPAGLGKCHYRHNKVMHTTYMWCDKVD
jgi:hypothetical protein